MRIHKREAINKIKELGFDGDIDSFLSFFYHNLSFSSREIGKLLGVSPDTVINWMPKNTKINKIGGRSSKQTRKLMFKFKCIKEDVDRVFRNEVFLGSIQEATQKLGVSDRCVRKWRKGEEKI